MNPWDCAHEKRLVRRRDDAAGRPMFREQCLACGRGVGVFIKRELVPADVTMWDHEIERAFDAEARSRIAQERQGRIDEWEATRADWFRQHSEYLRSDAWKRLRAKVIARDKGLCQGCLNEEGTEVHHRSYVRWRCELLIDLVLLCHACHEHCTETDREAREGQVAVHRLQLMVQR
jgi:hypothetical protein